jgi:hypothetical protein
VEVGGLMAYGPRLPELWRRAAALVGKILKGTKPSELPVEQAVHFDLVINLKTAKALDLAIPPVLLARADEVLQEWWHKMPTVTVAAPEKDRRIQLAREAVEFWNRQLAEIGTPFRLGPVMQTTARVPADSLARLRAAVSQQGPPPEFPEHIKRIPGDILIVMSEADFVSFSTRPRPGEKVVIGIRSDRGPPLSLPNVARNVIAHELGHAIGLGHNDDRTRLMCGRPAPCRPDAFQSVEEKFFPLMEEEKALLLKLYPSTWKPVR